MQTTYIKIFFFTIVISLSTFAQNNFEIKIKTDNNNYEEDRTLTVEIIKNEKEFYSISKNLSPHYSIPEATVFENGNLALLYSLEGTIEFYDSTQSLIAKEESLITKLYDEHKILFSKTSTEIALFILENNENRIIIYNSAGEQIFSFSLAEGIANGIVLSEESDKCAASLYNWKNNKLLAKSFIIDLINNTKPKQFPHLFSNGFFDESNNRFCGFTNKEFFQIDLLKNKVILNKKLPENKILLDVHIYNRNTYFIEANVPKLKKGIWNYQFAEVIKIDTDNNEQIVEKITFPFKKIFFKRNSDFSLDKTNSGDFKLEIIR